MKKLLYTLVLMASPLLAMEGKKEEKLVAKEILDDMTLEEKLGQLFMPAVVIDEASNKEFMAKSPYTMNHAHIQELIENYEIGGLVFIGKGTTHQLGSRIHEFQERAGGIPLLVAIDAEWGLNMRLEDAPRLPRAMTLGAIPPKHNHLIRDLAQYIGSTCEELGVGMNLAPVADVNNNPHNQIIGTRSFGESPLKVAQYANLYAKGLQDAGIIACAKHFPGHGQTGVDSHKTLPCIPFEFQSLDLVEIFPFRELCNQKVPAIMMGHLCLQAIDPENPASLSKMIVSDLLQKRLNFKGLIITDALGMGALGTDSKPGEIELRALLAGNDILLGARHIPEAIELIKNAIEDETLTEEEIDEHVEKILQTKIEIAEAQPKEKISFPATLKKEIFRHAITLVKNNKSTVKPGDLILPIPKDLALKIYTHGKVLSKAFKKTMNGHFKKAKESDKTVILLLYPNQEEKMIDETLEENTSAMVSASQRIQKLHQNGKQVIAIVFDSPYRIAEVADADAILCAYEDDSEAQYCAALALLGYFDPTGVLPVGIGQKFIRGSSYNYSKRTPPLM